MTAPPECVQAPRIASRSLCKRTAEQGSIHRGDELIDGDLLIVIWIARQAVRYRAIEQRQVHHQDQLVDRDLAIPIAVAGTRE